MADSTEKTVSEQITPAEGTPPATDDVRCVHAEDSDYWHYAAQNNFSPDPDPAHILKA